MNLFLCASQKETLIVSLSSAIGFLALIGIYLCIWKFGKNRKISELFQIIGKFIMNKILKPIGRSFMFCGDAFLDLFSFRREVVTVYSDKSKNYSGTEFLPIPTKAPTDQFVYEFVGWDKNGVDSNGNLVVKAIYLQHVRRCVVNFYDEDKETLFKSLEVEYGAGTTADDLHPHKLESKEFTYDFIGWDKDITAFYSDTNVYAMYKANPKKFTYTFFDEDGKSIIGQGTAVYGSPIIAPIGRDKVENTTEICEFKFWSNYKEDMILTNDCSFVAVYDRKPVERKVEETQYNEFNQTPNRETETPKNENVVIRNEPIHEVVTKSNIVLKENVKSKKVAEKKGFVFNQEELLGENNEVKETVSSSKNKKLNVDENDILKNIMFNKIRITNKGKK